MCHLMEQKRISIRSLEISPPLVLAPMVSLTHSVLRQIVAEFGGAGLYSTEMLSAKRLPHDDPELSPYLIRTEREKPLSYQLLVASVSEIGRALDALQSLGADAVDLNLGCPKPGVTRIGGGLGLMARPDEVRRIVAEARKRTELPLTAKIRLGDGPEDRSLKPFCVMLQEEGIDMLSIHARLNHEPPGRRPRWEYLSTVKEWLSVPVIANGGIFSVQDAKECLRVSGADGLMLGRGAVVKPWLFAEIAKNVYGCDIAEPAPVLRNVYERFADLLAVTFGPEHRLTRLKQFTKYFAGNYQFGHYLATRVQSSASVEEALERAGKFFETVTPSGIIPEASGNAVLF